MNHNNMCFVCDLLNIELDKAYRGGNIGYCINLDWDKDSKVYRIIYFTDTDDHPILKTEDFDCLVAYVRGMLQTAPKNNTRPTTGE